MTWPSSVDCLLYSSAFGITLNPVLRLGLDGHASTARSTELDDRLRDSSLTTRFVSVAATECAEMAVAGAAVATGTTARPSAALFHREVMTADLRLTSQSPSNEGPSE